MLPWKQELVTYSMKKNHIVALLALGINDLCIFLNCFVHFHGIWEGGDAIQATLDTVIINPIASTIVKSHHCCIQCVFKSCVYTLFVL
jgi:hypothetical protein